MVLITKKEIKMVALNGGVMCKRISLQEFNARVVKFVSDDDEIDSCLDFDCVVVDCDGEEIDPEDLESYAADAARGVWDKNVLKPMLSKSTIKTYSSGPGL